MGTAQPKRSIVYVDGFNLYYGVLKDGPYRWLDLQRYFLVTGDSDLVPAVCMVKDLFPTKEVILYIPARTAVRGAAVELRGVADKHRLLPLELLPKSQFPAQITSGAGQIVRKPPSW